METPETQKNFRRNRTLLATALVLVIQLGVAILGRRMPDEAAVLWSAALAAIGTLTIAWVTAPLTPYTQAAHWISAGVLALSIAMSARIVPAEVWMRSARHELWLLAWFPLMMATLPAPHRGACSPRAARVGWLMVGVAAFLGATMACTGLITAWRHGG